MTALLEYIDLVPLGMPRLVMIEGTSHKYYHTADIWLTYITRDIKV